MLLSNELTDLKDFPPLLEDGEELLAAPIDLAAVIFKDIGLLDVSKIVLGLVLIMIKDHL